MKNRPIACCLSAARSILTHALLTLQVLSERRKLAVVTLAVTALAGATAAAGKDLTPADKGNGLSVKEEVYLKTWLECWKEFKAQCGRNLVDDGLSSGQPPSKQRVKESTATMERWLDPPQVNEVATSFSSDGAYEANANYGASTSAGGCVGMEAESGSAGYSAYNPSSGATGCYQVIPSTADAYGCDLSTPDGQDACAAAICEDVGSSAWSASGANPC